MSSRRARAKWQARSVRKAVARLFHVTHPYRATFWICMVPVAIFFGFHTSVFVIFLYSTYANFAGDIAAWEASSGS